MGNNIVEIDTVFNLMQENSDDVRCIATSVFKELFNVQEEVIPDVELTLNGDMGDNIELFQQYDNIRDLIRDLEQCETADTTEPRLPEWAVNGEQDSLKLEKNSKSILLLAILRSFQRDSWKNKTDYDRCLVACKTI